MRPAVVAILACAAVTTGCRGTGGPPEPGRPADSFEALARQSLATIDGRLQLSGLIAEVEVLRDEWGVPHIYAQNTDDLFFAQGFVVAQDRLWQMEIWRRTAEGRLAELVGREALPHDRLLRLLKYRGPFDDREWTSYHPEGKRIFTAYAAGVNAFIASVGDNLPVEFKLTGTKPARWTPEQLVLRARSGDSVSEARAELRLAQSIARLGLREADRRAPTVPRDELKVPAGLDVSIISDATIEALNGDLYGRVPRPELVAEYRHLPGASASIDMGTPELSPGSNNWAIGSKLTGTGTAIMVDDPHRQVTNPAHRYLIHLSAPGWNVAGATEAPLPGVIRGHNGRVAWGRTATETDAADVYVEIVNPANPNEVQWNGNWEPLTIVIEEIAVRNAATEKVQLKFSRHGPVFFEDREHHRAYALRSSLQSPGTAEYIGGMRLDQAAGARDCLTAANHMPTPPTNLVCADADGNIAFRIAVYAPARTGWTGRLPVPGTGEFEWGAERRVDLPSEYNPARGYIATANNLTQPAGFTPPYAYVTADQRYRRHERIVKMIESRTSFPLEEMMHMLRDSLNTEAVEQQKLFRGWTADDPRVEQARRLIADWDAVMNRDSAAAAVYVSWQRSVDRSAAANGDRRAVIAGLSKAIDALSKSQGSDPAQWRWGRMNRSEFPHPIVSAYDVPTVERSGGAGTVNAIGAVYRLITNFADPDTSMVTIGPGISGQPGSPFYQNLLDAWARNEFFTLVYRRPAVEAHTRHKLILVPSGR